MISGSGVVTRVRTRSPRIASILTPSSTSRVMRPGSPSRVETTPTAWPGRSRRRSYSAPRARATSARSVAASPASASTASSVSPGAISRDQVAGSGSTSGPEASAGATDGSVFGTGSGRTVANTSPLVSACACACVGAGGAGICGAAEARSGSGGPFVTAADKPTAITETPPAKASPAVQNLSLMSSLPFPVPSRVVSSAPRTPSARDSRRC